MDWSEIGDAVKNYAPLVGMALSSPLGTAEAVGQLVANVFGTKATPSDVLSYINADPQKAQERLQHELSNNIEFQKVCLSKIQESNRHSEAQTQLIVEDKESARNNSENINKSPVDNDIKKLIVRGLLSLLGIWLVIVVTIVVFKIHIEPIIAGLLGTAFGVFSKPLSSLIDFYWGSAFIDPSK